jgi:hypothetical protein
MNGRRLFQIMSLVKQFLLITKQTYYVLSTCKVVYDDNHELYP